MKFTTKIFLYSIYSYFTNIFYFGMELLPSFVRNVIFKFVFKKIGRNCLLDYRTYFRYPSRISLGNNVTINRDCALYASYMVANVEIRIGNNVALSPHVRIFTASHDYSTLGLDDTAASVIIEDYAWIGGGATILPGVIIGEGAVIGAGAVVTKNVPPYSVAIGNPARVIKTRVVSH